VQLAALQRNNAIAKALVTKNNIHFRAEHVVIAFVKD
jgi:hypothetical protein